MSDAGLAAWWPDLGALIAALRGAGHGEVADALVDAVRGGATSTEILGRAGLVLHEHRALRARVGEAGARSWSAVHRDVKRAFPGFRLPRWLSWLR
jgi:hypothetical protein